MARLDYEVGDDLVEDFDCLGEGRGDVTEGVEEGGYCCWRG